MPDVELSCLVFPLLGLSEMYWPLCAKGLRMHPTYQFSHTYGYLSQRFRCPLLFPEANGQTCDHPQFLKEKGCVKDLNWELGGQMRVTLDRESPLYKGIYQQRTCTLPHQQPE